MGSSMSLSRFAANHRSELRCYQARVSITQPTVRGQGMGVLAASHRFLAVDFQLVGVRATTEWCYIMRLDRATEALHRALGRTSGSLGLARKVRSLSPLCRKRSDTSASSGAYESLKRTGRSFQRHPEHHGWRCTRSVASRARGSQWPSPLDVANGCVNATRSTCSPCSDVVGATLQRRSPEQGSLTPRHRFDGDSG
jgi:hypothetical protein